MKRTVVLFLALAAWLAPSALSAWQCPSPNGPAQNAVPDIHSQDPHRLAVRDASCNETVWYPTGFYGAAMNMATGETPPATLLGGLRQLPSAEAVFQAFANRIGTGPMPNGEMGAGLNFFRAWINWGASPQPSETNPDEWDYVMVHPYLRSNVPGAHDGGNKFDLRKFNPEYFSLLKREVEHAQSKGLVAQIVLFDCWHVTTNTPGFPGRDYFKSQNNIINDKGGSANWTTPSGWFSDATINGFQVDFAKEVVRTLGHYPNIIWETCNEDLSKTNLEAVSSWDSLIAGAISSVEGTVDPVTGTRWLNHLVVPLSFYEHRAVAGHETPPTGNSVGQTIESMHEELKNEQWFDNRVLISDNDCCEPPPLSTYGEIPRVKAWAALTAGAHINFFIDALSEKYSLFNAADIKTAMGQVALVQTFLRDSQVSLVGLVPSDDLVDNGAWAYAKAGDQYIVYLRSHTAPRTTVVEQLPANYLARWFNPRTGGFQSASGSPVANGVRFTPTDSSDWVLHIKKTTPPSLAFTQQPASTSVAVGANVSFSVAASGGTAPYAFRWQYRTIGSTIWNDLVNGSGVSGATTATLTLSSVPSSRAGEYRASVTDSSAPTLTIFSNAAQLTVSSVSPLAICAHPQSVWVPLGGSTTFAGTSCLGTAPYRHLWQFSPTGAEGTYVNMGGELVGTTTSYVIFNLNASHAGFYRVRVADAAGAVIVSNAARLSFQCKEGPNTLCVQNNRFKIETQYFDAGAYHPAKVASPTYSNWSGFFWFFDPTNLELGVKVLPGANAWWVFFGAGTDVDYKVTVTDTKNFDAAGNPVKKEYHHAQGSLCDVPDFTAFPKDYTAPEQDPGDKFGALVGDAGEIEPLVGSCSPNATTLCQQNGRFQVRVFRTVNGIRTAQTAVASTSNTGVFWFYNYDNAEVFVKVLDGTTINQAFWVFYGSLTDQQYEIEVVDTANSNPATNTKRYFNALGTYCGGGDVLAFPQPQ